MRNLTRSGLNTRVRLPVDPSLPSFLLLSPFLELVDYILFLTLDPSLNINPNEVSATRWVSKQDLEEFFKDPESTFTPWFKLIAESFLYKWWDALMDTKEGEKELDAKRLRSVVEGEKEVMGGIIRM